MFYIEIIFHWLYFFSFIPVVGITEGSYRLRKSWGFLGIFFKMVSNYLNMLRKRVFYTFYHFSLLLSLDFKYTAVLFFSWCFKIVFFSLQIILYFYIYIFRIYNCKLAFPLYFVIVIIYTTFTYMLNITIY